MVEVAMKSQDSLSEVLLAVQALTKVVATQQNKGRRRRFPYLCRNGPSCPWKACGACWFKHEAEERELPQQVSEMTATPAASLETKLAEVKANMEKKVGELSKYVDRCFDNMESKLEALAEAVFKQESDVLEMIAKVDSPDSKRIGDDLKSELERSWSAKLETKLDKAKLETNALFEATVSALVEKTSKRINAMEDILSVCFESLQSEPPSEPVATGG